MRQLLRGDVHPVPAGPRETDGRVEHRGGPGERGAQPAAGLIVRGGGRGRCAFGRRGDRPMHRALVRSRRALVLRASARPGAHGGVQRGRRRGVRGLRVAARDRVLRRSRSDRNCGLLIYSAVDIAAAVALRDDAALMLVGKASAALRRG